MMLVSISILGLGHEGVKYNLLSPNNASYVKTFGVILLALTMTLGLSSLGWVSLLVPVVIGLRLGISVVRKIGRD